MVENPETDLTSFSFLYLETDCYWRAFKEENDAVVLTFTFPTLDPDVEKNNQLNIN